MYPVRRCRPCVRGWPRSQPALMHIPKVYHVVVEQIERKMDCSYLLSERRMAMSTQDYKTGTSLGLSQNKVPRRTQIRMLFSVMSRWCSSQDAKIDRQCHGLYTRDAMASDSTYRHRFCVHLLFVPQHWHRTHTVHASATFQPVLFNYLYFPRQVRMLLPRSVNSRLKVQPVSTPDI